jgi:hypothetical protein
MQFGEGCTPSQDLFGVRGVLAMKEAEQDKP